MPSSNELQGVVVGGRYRVERLIAEGGCGIVYEASDVAAGGTVALKMLHLPGEGSAPDPRRFELEAKLLSGFEHPRVVRMLGFGWHDASRPFIALERLTGSSLAERLKESGALPLDLVAEIAAQVLQALGAAHSAGIVHRDIKPSNIFLCSGPRQPDVKVLDFGLAKARGLGGPVISKLTKTGQLLGTPHYMAPEQARGDEVGPATDLYALGLVIGEAIGGEKIVQGRSALDVLMAHVLPGVHRLPDKVRRSLLGGLVAHAIDKEPAARPASAAQMLAELDDALDGATARIGKVDLYAVTRKFAGQAEAPDELTVPLQATPLPANEPLPAPRPRPGAPPGASTASPTRQPQPVAGAPPPQPAMAAPTPAYAGPVSVPAYSTDSGRMSYAPALTPGSAPRPQRQSPALLAALLGVLVSIALLLAAGLWLLL